MVNFPTTLIIGLGGVGSEIAAEIYRKFISTNPSEIEKRNIICLGLDTDAGDVSERKKILPEKWVVKTSSDMSFTVGDYINTIKDTTTVLDWFDTRSERVMNMSLNEGAGQLRMCSRLALMSAMSEQKLKTIDNAISSLLELDPERHNGNEIKIHIVCSLAGGTGAGSFLQTAYYVKDVLRNDYHVKSPKITGYFVLADVLCNDRALGFNKTQIENTRSNTYACMKELDAMIHHDKIQVIRPIEFEFKFNQSDKFLPKGSPYDQCYLIDFTTREGQNLNNKEQYYAQVEDYVYLNVFTDIGKSTRSRLINDIRQQVENDGIGAYSAIGVSKLVYPVDDLFAYFANQKLVDNLNLSWIVIDEYFKKEWKEYKKKMNAGEKATEPDKGATFINNVQKFAKNGTGLQKTIFNNIYNSTGVLDAEMVRVRPKSVDYLAAVEKHVEESIEGNDKFQSLYESCRTDMGSFLTEDDEINDIESIKEREEYITKFSKYAKDVVDKIKNSTINDCFLASHDEPNRVSADPAESKHQLNSYILQKDHEMHPIAVRYFLYEVRQSVKSRMTVLKEEVEQLQTSIDGYQDNFDVIDDKNDADNDYKENAEEMMGITYNKNSAFYQKLWHKFTGKSPIREKKQDYMDVSGKQIDNIKENTKIRLLYLTYEGLLVQIERLIEESELFFERLPDALASLKREGYALLVRHDNNIEPAVSYVLAESKFKKLIYEEEISDLGSVFFPEDMSAQIYRTMFDKTYNALQRTRKTIELSEQEKQEQWKAQVEADLKVFTEVLKTQEVTLRKESKYAQMNAIQALREEAEFSIKDETDQRSEKVFAYMQRRFDNLKTMAVTRGADSINTNINRPINSWGVHPECLKTQTINPQEKAALFGQSNIETNPLTAASLEVSPLFSKYEIIRADSIHLLELAKNFKGFVEDKTNKFAQGNVGVYYNAYSEVIGRIVYNDSEAYSPHLDKRWHLPSYMPNIGQSMDNILDDIFSSLCYGLLFDSFIVKSENGDDYWYAFSDIAEYIIDLDGNRISVKGKSVAMAINLLFESGLSNNPRLVASLLAHKDKEWDKARDSWLNVDNKTIDAMKDQPIVKRIIKFSFSDIYDIPGWKDPNFDFFYIVGDQNVEMIAQNIKKLRMQLFSGLTQNLIHVFGASANCYELCTYVFGTIKEKSLRVEALKALERMHDNGMFNPNKK